MPPLSDSLVRYQPSHITTAASRILAAYLAHHRMPAVEAARLAVRVESVLTELVSGRAPEVPPPPAEVETAPRRARRATPAKTPRARPRPAAEAAAAEEQAMVDLEAEAQAEADEVAAAMQPEVQPAPAPPAPAVEVEEEIDLLTGGPLPPATEPDYPAMAQAAATDDAPTVPGKKRKRPPRPASRRRAARVAAIEQLLTEGEEPSED